MFEIKLKSFCFLGNNENEKILKKIEWQAWATINLHIISFSSGYNLDNIV